MNRAPVLPAPPPSLSRQLRLLGLWGLWLLSLGVWTACLLTSAPVQASAQVFAPEPNYLVTNSTHVLAYALLAGALVWLPGRRKGWAVALLSLHAVGTEWAQRWTAERTADPLDVALNHLGIAGGLALAWLLARRRPGGPSDLKKERRAALPRGGAARLRQAGQAAGSAQ